MNEIAGRRLEFGKTNETIGDWRSKNENDHGDEDFVSDIVAFNF